MSSTLFNYPFFTIDTLTDLVSPMFTPIPALLNPLTQLALNPSLHSPILRITLLFYTLPIVVVHLLLYLDSLLAHSKSFGLYGKPRTLDWKSEVVVVTGGCGGLGRVMAERFAERGVGVAVLDVRGPGAVVERRWEEMGVRWWGCDVGVREEVERVAGEVRRELGTPTILINNAAIVNSKPFLELTQDDIERTYRINVLSHYHTIQTFLPDMLKRPAGGTIVTVSSVLGKLGCAGLSDYTSSKAAISTLHNSLQAELTLLARHASSSLSTSTSPTPHHPAPLGPISLILAHPGQLSTPLFSHVLPPPLSPFLGPTVPASFLASKIIDMIDSGQSGEIAEPLYARWIACVELLPVGVRGLVRKLAGVDEAGWRGVVGRKDTLRGGKRREGEEAVAEVVR